MTQITVETVLVACIQAALSGVAVRPEIKKDEDIAPYVIYTQITGTRVNSLAGDSGLANPKFQIDIYAETKPDCIAKKNLIRQAILGCEQLGAVFLNEGSFYEPETKLYRHRQDFSFWFYD